MTRLSGIQLLAASIVLWGLAVWLFPAPQPAETDAVAATGTTTPATGEKAEEPGAGADESAVAEVTTAPAAAGPTNPDPGAGDSALTDAPEHTGIATAAAPSTTTATAAATATPRADVRTPSATAGGSPDIAPVPAPAGGGPSAAPAAARPAIPGGSATGTPPGGMERPEVPSGATRPHPWFEHPLSLPPPPPGFSAGDGDPVAGQIAAARRAAWEGRYMDALSHYRAAARIRPNDYVVWGEMGNVLWTMRRWPEAAYALEGAATLLVRAGELRAASELVPAVGRIDPEAAHRVRQRLWAATRRPSE